jgi:hypothetical protein
MALAMAYVHNPVVKSIIYMIPLPFTAATLSLGLPVEASHVLGLAVLPFFIWGVRWMHLRVRLPILVADAVGAAGYCLGGWGLVCVVPRTTAVFWILLVALALTGLVLMRIVPERREAGHRTALPLVWKLPLTVFIVLAIVAMKGVLRGVMTFFPFVGVFAVYEARHSLWTLGWRCFTLILLLSLMLGTIRIFQDRLGLGAALALGWAVYLGAFAVVHRNIAATARQVAEPAE